MVKDEEGEIKQDIHNLDVKKKLECCKSCQEQARVSHGARFQALVERCVQTACT